MSHNIITAKSSRPTKEVNEMSFQELRKFLESKDIKYEDLKNIIDEEIRGRKKPFTGKITTLVDHSNLLEQGKGIVMRDENVVDKPNLYVDYEQLRKTIAKGRKLGGPVEIFCSRHSQNLDDKRLDRLWDKRRDQGFVVNLIKQRPNTKREKKVDTTLVMHGMKFLKERDPGILAIVAGDSDYVPLVEHALEKGWKVEIWFWSLGLSGEYKPEFSKFGRNYSLHFLDDEYKKFTYARGPESPRKFTFEIKHKCVEVLKEEPLLQLFVKWDLFGWWHWINNDHLLIYVNTEKQKEELERLFIIEEYKNLNSLLVGCALDKLISLENLNYDDSAYLL
ncbi:13017_t:CDS:2 [Funneliformis caledonium]|uniref:13017_t:CDS:1 n=1 Tax=Funneliformis caledonium TaxID=1117310 RepID=A0A9N8WJB5_9GLOM|nr:13017_t:CDS:2 [Funneliformis caledonium]